MLGMLSIGYAAGQRSPVDWTGLPWWHGLAFGAGLIVAAFAIDWRITNKLESDARGVATRIERELARRREVSRAPGRRA